LPFKSEKIKLITTNKSVTLALSYSGNIYSFGEDSNQYGTLGIAKIYFVPIPSRIGTDFKQISLSSHIACALDYSGKLWTWG
jgi:alpha-tubulin suppressor-like RCC1 family protein